MSKPVKIGVWGGAGGQPRDIIHTPIRLVRVTVCSGEAINSIKFTYMDNSGQLQEEGTWGGPGGRKQPSVKLESSEYVKEISGTFGPWGNNVPKVVTSLKFVTNKSIVPYEFGQAGSGGSFDVPVQEGQIIGFFGRAGDLIDAIGVYVLP